jgi:plasmid replication initiation protein
MRKLFVRLLERLTKSLKEEDIEIICQPQEISPPTQIENQILHVEVEETEKKSASKSKKKKPTDLTTLLFDPRDMMEIMEYPYLSPSKNRKTPIHYERKTSDGVVKIKVSCHTEHYIASIYDWDIIMFIESKMQETMNSMLDIPPRTFVIPRNELIRAIHKHMGKTTEREIEAALNRLRSTLIETTVRNEDYRYRSGFGWLDSWGYTERKDIKEFRITLSQWLYDGICQKGSLLKIRPEYFKITSGLKKILYRLARKHVGNQNESWTLSLETLYEKSGSERELKKFKHDLKKVVSDNDIPGYLLEWIEEDRKTSIRFINARKEIKRMLSEASTQPSLPFL